MARARSSNPVIRILLFGAPGVGKNCLESRFTTGHWPPSYDSSLTLCSRRFYTFQHGPSSASPGFNSNETASSPSPFNTSSPTEPKTPFSTASTETVSSSGSTGTSIQEGERSGLCNACLRKSQTYLIEIINYPRLGSPRHRQQVLQQGAYDAVLLVYSVGDRTSYDIVKKLHSEIPLRAQHKRRQSAARKNGGLLSMFTPSPMNGAKEAMGMGIEAVCEGMGSRRKVVAIAGNKCDLDGDVPPEKGPVEDNHVEDIDYSMALFGLPLLCDDRGGSSSTSSVLSNSHQHQHRLALNFSTSSSEALEEWLQVDKKNKTAEIISPDRARAAKSNSSGSRTTLNGGRQVSRADGEGLALELATQVPFFETSAKSGENVEELVETIAKAVLKEMGRGEINREELSGNCQHRNVTMTTGLQQSGSKVGIAAPRLEVPLFRRASAFVTGSQTGKNDSVVQQAEVKDLPPIQAAICDEQPVRRDQRADGQCPQIRKRPSMLGRMKMVWKKESTLSEGLTV